MAVSFSFAGFPCYDPLDLREQLAGMEVEPSAELSEVNSWTFSRGRHSSVGKLLMRAGDVRQMPLRQANRNELLIHGNARPLRFRHLSVQSTRAIWPSVTDQELSDDSPCLVTIGDARHDAPFATLNEQFGYRSPENAVQSVRVTDVVEGIWKSLKPVFAADLDVPRRSQRLESLRFWGTNAWDAFWQVLDLAGWSFVLSPEGTPRVFELRDAPADVEAKNVLDAAIPLVLPRLPRQIKAYSAVRDYQWHQSPTAHTARDFHEQRPQYVRTFETIELLKRQSSSSRLERLDSEEIRPHVEGAAATVWGLVPLVTDDLGTAVNEQEVDEHLEWVATRYAHRLLSARRSAAWTFAGVRTLHPSSRWGSVVYREAGAGLTTTLAAAEIVPQDGAWALTQDLPPQSLDVPYGREIYCQVVGDVSTSAEDDGEVPPNAACRVLAMSGQIAGGKVRWTGQHALLAYNATGRALKPNRMAFAKWNYQLGVGGAWCIVSAGGVAESDNNYHTSIDAADFAAQCVTGGAPVPYIVDPGLVVVDRKSMLRLIDLRGDSLGGVGIQMEPGPSNSVLNTQDGVIYWSDSPVVSQLLVHGGAIRFQATHINYGGGESSIGPSPRHPIEMRLPGPAGRSHKYLIAGPTSGKFTDLEWHGPGLDCVIGIMDPRDVMDHLCDYMANCSTGGSPLAQGQSWSYRWYQFSNGLLVNSSTGCKPPLEMQATIVRHPKEVNYNPCVERSEPSPGESPPESPGETPSDPGGFDPTDDPWFNPICEDAGRKCVWQPDPGADIWDGKNA